MKPLKFILFILTIMLFLNASCSRIAKNEKLPPEIWDKRQMVEFLTQAQLVEAKIKNAKVSAQRQDSLSEIYYNELFTHFNTDKESWERSLQYYKKNPEKLNEIYADVLTELSLLETELQNSNEKKK
ncbi:MAG: DUF4296 domain-containing protein [Bacteroidales bacterium]|jgi:hypothetical protein|nr:DUF4296 domain-containing protein [Bacteroidales bacterium]